MNDHPPVMIDLGGPRPKKARDEERIGELARKLNLAGIGVNLPLMVQTSQAAGIARALIDKGILTQEEADAGLRAVIIDALQTTLAQAGKQTGLLVPNGTKKEG